MKRWWLGCVLALAACQPAPVDPAFDEAAGAKLLAHYESARADGEFELAEARGNELASLHGETEAAATMRKTLKDVREQAQALRERRRLAALWEYQTVPAAGGEQRTAAIYSWVEVDPESEVQPVGDARLVLRRHPEWGDSAYLLLRQSELACGPPCRLKIRFDDGPVLTFPGDPADSGNGPALFIEDRERFIEALRQAQRVRIELPPSGHLVPVFEFEVGGFRPAPGLLD